MKHELAKKKQLLLSLQKSIRRQGRIKFLIHRLVLTQDFASEAQDQKESISYREKKLPCLQHFAVSEISPLHLQPKAILLLQSKPL